MVDLELAYLSAGEQARRVACRDISPVELVDNALARSAEVNNSLNCFCFMWDDEARAAARRAADAITNGDQLGVLHGVPIALKDTTPTAGHRTTLGSYSHEHWVPQHDGAIAAALQRAGAIVIAKTTTPEFAHSLVTESPLWGVTRNPWNTDLSTGGSSGGSGAAVASGCVALAEGSDMGGSVRIPAAWCGVVGLKPGLGRIPMDALPALFDTISHHGPLARCVDDARLFLSATQGPDETDPLSVTAPLALAEPLVPDVRGKRIGFSMDLDDWYIAPGVAAAVQAAADALADAGAQIVEVHPRFSGVEEQDWNKLWEVFMATYYGHLVADFGERMDPHVIDLIERGFAMSAVEYKKVEYTRTDLWRRMSPILEQNDAFLCPTMATGPIPASISDWNPSAPDDGRNYDPDMTAVWNLISPCPVLTVPCGLDDSGMPVGAQLVGRRWDELGLLRVGRALEAVVGPVGRPPLPR